MKGGVPQGSALGPLLFLIYVNAMPSLVECGRLLQFADDTILICSGDTHDDVQQQLEHDLRLLFFWINSSKMKLNTSKSSLMWFKSKRSSCAPHPPFFIDNHQLQGCLLFCGTEHLIPQNTYFAERIASQLSSYYIEMYPKQVALIN